MKKILLIIICILFVCGCSNVDTNKEVKDTKPEIKKEEVKKDYIDQNKTPIAIYQLNGNFLTKLTNMNKKLIIEEDIGIFQVFPSNEDNISLDKSFGQSYYEHWQGYKSNTNLKVGFNIKFHKNNGEDVSFNILKPDDCMAKWEHFMTYLYDDYANQGKGFYSHIENKDYNENTLFTALKIQSSYQVGEVDSKILLTVFTYDTEDDFDENGEYRGNSKYTMTICPEGINC